MTDKNTPRRKNGFSKGGVLAFFEKEFEKRRSSGDKMSYLEAYAATRKVFGVAAARWLILTLGEGDEREHTPEEILATCEKLYGGDESTPSRKNHSGRPKGYAPWNPQKKTRVVLDQVEDILGDYRAYLPLTIRQVFYILVGNYGYPKDENAYSRLCEYLNRARRAKIIDFADLRDDGLSVMRSHHYADANDFYAYVNQLGRRYERDKLANQGVDVRLFCEAAGMMPQLHNVTDDYSIPVYSCSGFDSLTAKYELAHGITRRFTYEGKPTVVLHLGDYDPSGVSIYESMKEDVLTFVANDVISHPAEEVAIFERVALNPDQIYGYDLTTYPAKVSDGRAKEWLAEGRETCQLEALPPDLLASELHDTIMGVLDEDQLKLDREEEENERQQITLALPGGE